METTIKSKAGTKQRTEDSSNKLVIQRVFDLPVQAVWAAITEPEFFKKWWGPNGFSCPYAKLESKVGAKWLAAMRGPDGKDIWSTGVVKELVPNKKLVVTDNFSDEKGNVVPPSKYGMSGNWPDECLVTYQLEEADGATKLRLEHDGIPPEMHDDCVKGWNECFDKLEKNIQ